jgi:hypothetical protein
MQNNTLRVVLPEEGSSLLAKRSVLCSVSLVKMENVL